ncbi:MAG: exodeoxyribonuclease VII small subunit [Uliginosibacterium sp.]|jgi:exodeoxyribonuclease VII small subunit|nr:exodeoxyribonuclease VII small subunit [Uliginosibacterium sp.]
MVKKEHATAPASFETAVSELEAIVATMERDDLPLEDALAAYQRGIGLLRHCQSTLSAAEQRVRVLEQGVLHDLVANENGQAS